MKSFAVYCLVPTTCVVGMLLCGQWVHADTLLGDLLSRPWGQIKQERQALKREQSTLPVPPVPHFTERLGYHSGYSRSTDTVEWVEIDLGRAEPLDAVVLVAAGSHDDTEMQVGYGFPTRFRVEIATTADQVDRKLIADYTREDFPNPGALPVYLSCSGIRARFVRITATKLFNENGRALLALGEIFLLQGKINLATRIDRNQFTYSRTMGSLPVWGLLNLRDGHSVLGPPEGNIPSPTKGFCSKIVDIPDEPIPAPRWVEVDFGKIMKIDEVRLFPAHPEEFAHRPGYGWPPEMRVELADNQEFKNSVSLLGFPRFVGDNTRDPMNPGDNVITFVAPDTRARYVRATAERLFNANGMFNFALAELQAWSGNTNVALNKPVKAFDSTETDGWSRAAMVDGFTSRANILDWGDWLKGLSRYREIDQRLEVLHSQHKAANERLARYAWWAGALVAAAILIVLIAMNLRQRRLRAAEINTLRQRISQDLHDEIGSSLGTISLISEETLLQIDDEKIAHELELIRDTAEQTIDSMRDIIRVVSSGNYGTGNLNDLLRDIVERMLQGVDYKFHADDSHSQKPISISQRRDMVLMLKEALHNLIRHSGATDAIVDFQQLARTLTLVIQDNGQGFDPNTLSSSGMGLRSMQHRAEKYGGSLQIVSSPNSGTTLRITVPRND